MCVCVTVCVYVFVDNGRNGSGNPVSSEHGGKKKKTTLSERPK